MQSSSGASNMLGQAGRASTWCLRAVELPDGESVVDRWLGPSGWSTTPLADAQPLPGGWALMGLIDAHSHVSLVATPTGPRFGDAQEAERARDAAAADGVAVLRDVGGDPQVVLGLPVQPGRPHIVAAGRHLAPAGRYFPSAHLPVEPTDLVATALAEVAAGARWVKIVADFSRADDPGHAEPPEPTYDLTVLAELVKKVHAAGARVAAHVTTEMARDLLRLGVDSVEHAPGLTQDDLVLLRNSRAAWVPTLCAVLSAPPDASPDRLHRVAERREHLRTLLATAVASGIPVLTGSDGVGSVPREIALFVTLGVSPADALRCGTTTAMTWLGEDLTATPESVVTYLADPREDPEVLQSPAAVVLGGVRVR